jgi:predicted PurR-regulated permease PerM
MSHPQPFLTRSPLFTAVFFASFLFLIYQLLQVLAPFSSALIWAAVITLALAPVHGRVLAAVKGRATLAAAVMTAGTLLVVIGPAVVILIVLANQAAGLYRWASDLVQSGRLAEAWSAVALPFLDRVMHHPLLAGIDVKGLLVGGLKDLSSNMAAEVGVILKSTALFSLNLVIMLFSLFFLFRDGGYYYENIAGMLPFTKTQRETILRKFLDTFSGVINGVFLISLLQGFLTGLGFAVFGISFAVFWGFLAAMLALLPVGGAALVWLPGAAYLFLTGSKISALLLAAWGIVLVTLPDNFLKPLLIGRKARIPVFLLFLGILGGLKAYGILGILFGPLVVTLLTAFVEIYREEFAVK